MLLRLIHCLLKHHTVEKNGVCVCVCVCVCVRARARVWSSSSMCS